jgi:hypothetical protein
MNLAGALITATAAHDVKANLSQIVQGNGGDFFVFLKAKQLLSSDFPPSDLLVEQGTRPLGGA